jgi:hypothetical protein
MNKTQISSIIAAAFSFVAIEAAHAEGLFDSSDSTTAEANACPGGCPGKDKKTTEAGSTQPAGYNQNINTQQPTQDQ